MRHAFKLGLIVLAFLSAGCGPQVAAPFLPFSSAALTVDDYPFALAVDRDRRQLLVSCLKSAEVAVINSGDMSLVKKLAVRPGPARFITDGRLAYCLHLYENTVSFIQWNPPQLLREMGTGSLTLAGGQLRPGTREVWVADGVSKINILLAQGEELKLKDTMTTGRFPQSLAFSPDGSQVWIALKGENAVAVVAAASRSEIKRITVGVYPSQLAVANGQLAVTNIGSDDVSLIDLRTLEETKRVAVLDKPNNLAVLDGWLWVACEDSRRLVGIDLATARVAAKLKLGFNPGAMVALPNRRLAVADPGHHQVHMLSLGENPSSSK